MSDLKETTKIQVESAVVAVEEREVSLVNAFRAMKKWKRIFMLSLLISILPLYLLARIGIEQYELYKLKPTAVTAQRAFADAYPPEVGSLKIIRNPNGLYSAYVEIANPNLELSASLIDYTAKFKDINGTVVQTTKGNFHLLPDERKFLVIPRVESAAPIASGDFGLGEVTWQKRVNLPMVNLRISDPLMYEEVNPLTFVVEGSIINQSPYTLQTVTIAFVLYDKNDKIVAVSQREENTVAPYGRRAYKQVWPGLYAADIAKVRVIPYTNTTDAKNLILSQPNDKPNE